MHAYHHAPPCAATTSASGFQASSLNDATRRWTRLIYEIETINRRPAAHLVRNDDGAGTLCCLRRNPADAVLLETGLGGLLDATNVMPIIRPPPSSRVSRMTIRACWARPLTAIAGDTRQASSRSTAPVILSASAPKPMPWWPWKRPSGQEVMQSPLFVGGQGLAWSHQQRSTVSSTRTIQRGRLDLPSARLAGRASGTTMRVLPSLRLRHWRQVFRVTQDQVRLCARYRRMSNGPDACNG